MKRLIIMIACIAGLSTHSFSEAQGVSVDFDTEFSRQVLEEVCSGEEIDESAIRGSSIVQEMLTHFVRLRSDFTIDNYLAARSAAARCEVLERDIFRFRELIDRKSQLTAEIQAIGQKQEDFTTRASHMVQALSPQEMTYQGKAVLMVGTPSCGGWSVGQNFYLDVPCIKGDHEGLLYLVAHEIYHGVQDMFMGIIDDDADPVVKLFDTIIREGSAQNLADVMLIESPGAYSTLGQSAIKKNRRRMSKNFDLLELMVAYLKQPTDPNAFDKVYAIGASGVFDSPLYAIGETMTSELRTRHGDQATVCVMSMPQNYFFVAYDRAVMSVSDSALAYPLPAAVRDAVYSMAIDEAELSACLRSE